jgi:WXG100 family type VII secretion target
MSDLIKVPYTELFQRATRIRQEADAVRTEIQLLTETVESIQWMGKRADKFFSLWQEAKPEMETWVQTLEAFAASLEQQARSMQAADEGF